ncbi:MAG: lamin tail domain-containing protein [Phycisphaeraceae bacterium]|nr:lamin tail domain-containing protein [Phycisphaeraceae bacterium]
MKSTIAIIIAAGAAAIASADIRITEWMYDGTGGEFVELTNVGAAPIDLTGWSYDDDSRLPGVFDLSGFGTVAPGESVIFTEVSADAFRTNWGLSASVKVLGGYTNNLGRADEINIYDASTPSSTASPTATTSSPAPSAPRAPAATPSSPTSAPTTSPHGSSQHPATSSTPTSPTPAPSATPASTTSPRRARSPSPAWPPSPPVAAAADRTRVTTHSNA